MSDAITTMSNKAGYQSRSFVDHNGNFGEYFDLEDNKLPLYAKQKQVPMLQVPDLNQSLQLFLKSARPHVTAEEFEKTKKCVEEMAAPNSFARELHSRLLNRAEECKKKNTSWFIDWWNQWAYLTYRDSVVHNVTYQLLFKDECTQQMANPTRRAARFVHHALGYRQMVVNGTLTPDGDAKTGLPWENSQHKYVFNCCRMPRENADISRTYAPDLFSHIVVARKNNFYSFTVLKNAQTGEGLSVDEIQIQFDRVMKLADSRGTDPNPVGILTAEDRDVWTAARRTLVSTGNGKINEASLEEIQSAVFMVCFDDEAPVARRDVAKHMLHGGPTGSNRFWDKSFQIAVTSNGKMAYIGEHSMTDGMTTTRFVNYVLERMVKDPESTVAIPTGARPSGPYASGSSVPLAEPKYLKFELSKDTIASIKRAEITFVEITNSKEVDVLMFHGFGADKVKTFGVSPDAFAQVAIQLAYRKTFGYCRGTYESTQTRTFMHGRTEVTRSVSLESEAFCDAFQKSEPRAQIAAKLYEACKVHSEYTHKASKGMGCDRHLLALKFLIRPNEKLPSLYSDPGYVRSGHWAISTSGLVGEFMDGWAFGEVVPDGLGIGYSVQKSRLRFSVSSRHPQEKWASRTCQALEDSLMSMAEICEGNPKSGLSGGSKDYAAVSKESNKENKQKSKL